jgi:hypothetical protein
LLEILNPLLTFDQNSPNLKNGPAKHKPKIQFSGVSVYKKSNASVLKKRKEKKKFWMSNGILNGQSWPSKISFLKH